MLSPPKYPSAANVGAVVRDFSTDTPRYVAPSAGDGVVHDVIPFGITCGVSLPCRWPLFLFQPARSHDLHIACLTSP